MSNTITTLIGSETINDMKHYTQVYMATHEGERYLPFMNRSFISFSFGGKNIEDFNLIATVSGDRWEDEGYANFEDLTTTYDVINGQFYWNTYFHTNNFDFELSTDGIDLHLLDEFLRWFKAGEIRELVLAEHPNRAILARVSAVPLLSMIPFELKKEVKLNGVSYTVSTTEYKGTVKLQLVSDDPFWHAKVNVFGHFDASVIYSDWKNANGDEVGDLLNDPDILKVVFEDGIPLSSMVKETIALGGSVYATVDAELRSRIAKDDISQAEYEEAVNGGAAWYGSYNDNGTTVYYKGAAISAANASIEFATGVTAGALMNNASNITLLNPVNAYNDNYIYFYYAGTAPAPMILEFDLYPIIDNNSKFIISPYNQFTIDSNKPYAYNSIFIESIHTQELKLTTPNFYTSYNQVINMLNTLIGKSWVEIRKLIRDTIHHSIIRSHANRVIDEIIGNNDITIYTENYTTVAKLGMLALFMHPTSHEVLCTHIRIDSKTGDAIGIFQYCDTINNTVVTTTENIQDMLLSNNLIIKDRNFPDSNGNIVRWLETNDITRSYSHRLYHNLPVTLRNIHITYQYLYL